MELYVVCSAHVKSKPHCKTEYTSYGFDQVFRDIQEVVDFLELCEVDIDEETRNELEDIGFYETQWVRTAKEEYNGYDVWKEYEVTKTEV